MIVTIYKITWLEDSPLSFSSIGLEEANHREASGHVEEPMW
jgi:hypothetical protein